MKSVSVSELKSKLSEHLRWVRSGEQLVVTDRGHPVAVIGPYPSAPGLDELSERGLVRPGRGRPAKRFWSLPRPQDTRSALRQALADERAEGR